MACVSIKTPFAQIVILSKGRCGLDQYIYDKVLSGVIRELVKNKW